MKTVSVPSATVCVVGDVAFGGRLLERTHSRGVSLSHYFGPIEATFRKADMVIVNLEGPIGSNGTPRAERSAWLHNEPAILDWMAGLPCCICNLANNHALDYGPEGLHRTRRLLTERGILFLGAGDNAAEAGSALRIKSNGLTLGLLAFTTDEPHVGALLAGPSTSGCGGLPPPCCLFKQIQALSCEVDGVIILLHWGHEFYQFPTPRQVHLAHGMVEAGATLVVGHHPHVQQGCEKIGSSLISYSLGNLFLPDRLTPAGRVQYAKPVTRQFAILQACLSSQGVVHWCLHGGHRNRQNVLQPYRDLAAKRFATKMEMLSLPLKSFNYQNFWATYSGTRERQLRLEAVRDAFVKLLTTDILALLRTLSHRDIERNWRRLMELFGRPSAGENSGSRRKGAFGSRCF